MYRSPRWSTNSESDCSDNSSHCDGECDGTEVFFPRKSGSESRSIEASQPSCDHPSVVFQASSEDLVQTSSSVPANLQEAEFSFLGFSLSKYERMYSCLYCLSSFRVSWCNCWMFIPVFSNVFYNILLFGDWTLIAVTSILKKIPVGLLSNVECGLETPRTVRVTGSECQQILNW